MEEIEMEMEMEMEKKKGKEKGEGKGSGTEQGRESGMKKSSAKGIGTANSVSYHHSLMGRPGERNYTLISTSTPEGSSSFMRASIVLVVEL